jgi:hypothetical protein
MLQNKGPARPPTPPRSQAQYSSDEGDDDDDEGSLGAADDDEDDDENSVVSPSGSSVIKSSDDEDDILHQQNEQSDLLSPLGVTKKKKLNLSNIVSKGEDGNFLTQRQTITVSLKKNQRHSLTEILSSPEVGTNDDSIGSLGQSASDVFSPRGVRFNDEMDVNQFSKLGNSVLNEIFYASDEIAEFRYHKHMEDCGLDPEDFD